MYKNIYILDETHKAYFLYSGDGERFGLVVEHQCVDGPTEDLLPFREDGYKVTDEESLTLDRYILCHECGSYGSIENGSWKPYVHKKNS